MEKPKQAPVQYTGETEENADAYKNWVWVFASENPPTVFHGCASGRAAPQDTSKTPPPLPSDGEGNVIVGVPVAHPRISIPALVDDVA